MRSSRHSQRVRTLPFSKLRTLDAERITIEGARALPQNVAGSGVNSLFQPSDTCLGCF